MPICTHAKIFSDFNLLSRFLSKKSITEQIIAAMRQINCFFPKQIIAAMRHKTCRRQKTAITTADTRYENRTISESELNSEHYPQVSIVMDILKDLHSG